MTTTSFRNTLRSIAAIIIAIAPGGLVLLTLLVVLARAGYITLPPGLLGVRSIKEIT